MGIVVPDTAENAKLCICPGCPTFKGSKLNGILFCAKGKAKETVKQQGCNCSQCPVTSKNGLKEQYYCDRGKSA